MTNEVLDRAAGYATCQILTSAGSSLVGVGSYTLATGGVGFVPLALGSLSLLGAGFACQSTNVDGTPPSSQEGCQKVNGTGAIAVDEGGGLQVVFPTSNIPGSNAVEITNSSPFLSAATGRWTIQVSWIWTGGTEQFVGNDYDTEAEARSVRWGLLPNPGSTCERGPDPLPPLPPEATDPITYTDPVTNCTYNVELLGFVQAFSGGTQDPVYVIESASDLLSSSGGIVGGCNFSPTVYYGGSGGGGDFGDGGGAPPFSYAPGDGPNGVPNWLDTLAAALAGAAGAIGVGLVKDAIETLLEQPYAGTIYRMVSVCEKDSSGEPISEAVEVPIAPLKAPDAQLARLDAIVELLQAAKNFKQPVCPPDRPALLGDWVTVRFESIENSPQGTRPLRKLFRYRSQSALDLGQIAAYWENFTWNAGPVCVQHKNASWGTPQCWAANVDEGKRVIRFAGLEAGIDPDAVGEWVISGSSDPRFGMPGTMQVAKVEGLEWITSRQGPSGLPLLTVDP